MKGIVAMALLAASCARAEWGEVREGFDPKTVASCVGLPLIETNARGGTLVTWIYDEGGYVLFDHGRVLYLQTPHPKKHPAPPPPARVIPPPVSDSVAHKDNPPAKPSDGRAGAAQHG